MALRRRRPSMPTPTTTTTTTTTFTGLRSHPSSLGQGHEGYAGYAGHEGYAGYAGRAGEDGEEQDDTLARWLAMTDQANADRSGRVFWQLVGSPTFADLWYEARAAGERLRARAVAALYAHHAHPGGPHPDPRLPAAYSERAIVAQAFRQLNIPIWQQPPCVHHDDREPLVLLMTYPRADQMPPKLIIHAETEVVPQALLLFHMACMLGFITREYGRLLDPDAPHGATLLPTSRGAQEVLHQYAYAFLYLEPRCPPEWRCQCNAIRRRYNQPPAEHDQPTDTLSLADLQAQIRASGDQ